MILGITVGTVPGTVQEAVRTGTSGRDFTVVCGVISATIRIRIGKGSCGGIGRAVSSQTCGATLDATAKKVLGGTCWRVSRRTCKGTAVMTPKGIRE